MSEPTESEVGQQNQANDVPNPNASTAVQRNVGLFAMSEVPGTDELIKKKYLVRRGQPKNKSEGTQSDEPRPLKNIKQKQNEEKRKRVKYLGLSSTTDDYDSYWESFIKDEVKEPLENQLFERLQQRIIRLRNSNKRRDQKILENERKNAKTAAEKRIYSLNNTVNKLSEQVRILQSSPPHLVPS